jgi:hypothetical protein
MFRVSAAGRYHAPLMRMAVAGATANNNPYDTFKLKESGTRPFAIPSM